MGACLPLSGKLWDSLYNGRGNDRALRAQGGSSDACQKVDGTHSQRGGLRITPRTATGVWNAWKGDASHLLSNGEAGGCRNRLQGLCRVSDAGTGETAVEKGCHIRLSRDPLLPDHIDGILFEESGFAVVVVHPKECPEGVRRVDLRRFVRIREARDCKRALLYAERMKRAMLGGAEEALEEAKEHHFALEEIYSLAMDFAKKERFTEEFCAKLFATPCQIGENVVE